MNNTTRSSLGKMRISDEAIATIASIASKQVPGVVGLSGNLMDNLSELLGRSLADKGVKVQMGLREVSIDISIVCEFGADIPEVTWQVQEKVREAVESMTGLVVKEINVNIHAVVQGKSELETSK